MARQNAFKKVVHQALGPAAANFGREVQPLGQEVGELTVRTVRALLRPVSGLIWGFEQIEGWVTEAVAEKFKNVPEEHRIEPKLTIAGPIIDSMKYSGSEPHLRELFANLLVTSMDARTAANAHPAFVEIVKQLSPDEAKIVKMMAKGFHEAFPMIYIYRGRRVLKKDTTTGQTALRASLVFGPYSTIGRYSGCRHLRLIPSYITNLVRLQLVNLSNRQKLEPEILDDLLDDEIVKEWKRTITARDRLGERDEFHHTESMLYSTPLGEQFFDACIRLKPYGE
jgi:hypothetical protein